jgi:hypothetical protein
MKATVRIGAEEHSLSPEDILAVAQREAPRRLNAYYVDIDGRRYPPKQLIQGATRTSQPFVTALAVRALRILGFDVVAIEKND